MSGVYRKYKNSVFLKLKCLVTCSEVQCLVFTLRNTTPTHQLHPSSLNFIKLQVIEGF